MIARLVALAGLALLAGCLNDHPPGTIQTGDNDCATCHLHDYQATTMPAHPTDPARFSRACGDCHQTTGWQPALEGPHVGRFPRGGAHGDVACLACHDPARGPSAGGANTICALCHQDAHHRDPANPSGCLTCHRSGGGD